MIGNVTFCLPKVAVGRACDEGVESVGKQRMNEGIFVEARACRVHSEGTVASRKIQNQQNGSEKCDNRG